MKKITRKVELDRSIITFEFVDTGRVSSCPWIHVERIAERPEDPEYWELFFPVWSITMRNRILNVFTGKPTRTELVETFELDGPMEGMTGIKSVIDRATDIAHHLLDGVPLSSWDGELRRV